MKKIMLHVIAFLPLAALAQSPFTVKGTGNAFKDGDRIFLVYKLGDTIKTDSTTVVNHAFELKGTIAGVAKGTLYKNENPLFAEFVDDAAGLYIEPGNILVNSPDSLHHAVISGTSANMDYMVLSADLKDLLQKGIKIKTDFDALTPEQQKDVNFISAFRKKLRDVNKAMEPIRFAFIKDHPGSYISLVTLSELTNNAELSSKIEGAYKRLTPYIKETRLGKSLWLNIEASVKSAAGLMAVDFSQPGPDGKLIKLPDFRGKYVLVDFWASWCAPAAGKIQMSLPPIINIKTGTLQY
ncbi:MAG: DUF4369 domain-containing protein [Sphingobacteriales bacterium]